MTSTKRKADTTMTDTTNNELQYFWRDLDDTLEQAKELAFGNFARPEGSKLMRDFLHIRLHLWPLIKADATANADHLAMLNAALLIRNKQWDVATTLTRRGNALRCRPITIEECTTDAEREAWQLGFEFGARSNFVETGADPDDLVKQMPDHVHEVATEGGWWTGDAMQRMPWTRSFMTTEQIEQWIAGRKEAGAAIDIKTCELGCWPAMDCYPYDPFGEGEINPYMTQVGTNRYVRSPDSNGWINEEDLPLEKFGAMYDRIHREFDTWTRANPDHPRAQHHLEHSRATQ
jgi:hypothetical protein